MIGKSFSELILIRTSIFLLRAVPYIACAYSAIRLVVPQRGLPQILEYWLFGEGLFHCLLYLPRCHYLQKAAIHPPVLQRSSRRVLFERCISCLPTEADRIISLWFLSSSPSEIRRENYIDWLLWAFFSTDDRGCVDVATIDGELNEYMVKIQNFTGRTIEPGWNPSIKPMRLTLDPVVMLPRPLFWYVIVALVDYITYTSLHLRGFKHYNPPLHAKVFPPRPQTLFSKRSVVPQFPYWYRPHRSSRKLPVIVLHGIGIGIWPYVPFIAELKNMDPDVGILVLEILPISMRITFPMPSKAQFIEQLTNILALHNIANFALISHSYGSVLTAYILRSSLAPRVASMLLVDPVSFLLFNPDVAYNFVYRQPETANQWQLWYFASRDMGISHTISRHFFWTDSILWKEDLLGRKVGVILSGEDQIIDSLQVWRYLTDRKDEPCKSWRDEKDDLHVLWFPGLDHAQVFDTSKRRRLLLGLIEKVITSS